MLRSRRRLAESRDLPVGGVAATVAEENRVLADGREVHELVGQAAAHDADVCAHGDGGQPAAGENSEVGPVERPVLAVQTFLVLIQAVGVLHRELPGTDQASPRPRVVPKLRLQLVDEPRQLLVRVHLSGDQPSDYLLVGHRQHHRPIPSVPQPDELGPDARVPPRPLPDPRGLHDRHRDLLPLAGLHLLPQDVGDLVQGPLRQGQVTEHPGRQRPNEPSP